MGRQVREVGLLDVSVAEEPGAATVERLVDSLSLVKPLLLMLAVQEVQLRRRADVGDICITGIHRDGMHELVGKAT